MTKAEVQVLENDVVLFPAKTEREVSVTEIRVEKVETEKKTLRIDIKKRFARLKKSMRKRSAGIL